MNPLEALKDYATPRQAEYIDAVIQHGSEAKAAAALGVHKSAVGQSVRAARRKAAREGYAPGHFQHGVAPGYLMGKVTVQRDADGAVLQTWERQSPDAALREEAIREWIAGIAESAEGLLRPLPPRTATDDDLLVVVPMGDPHFGLYAWAVETGDDFDLEIAEQVTFDAVDRLCARTPAASTAILLNLGDYFHADDSKNRTPQSGHALDVDTRFALVVQVGLRALVRCVHRLREKHARVIVRCNPGNHDPHTAFMLSLCLSAFFKDDPTVEIDLSPAHYWYFRFGRVLIGSAHGDGAKPNELPLLMASDRPEDWGATAFRHWLCGHVHHRSEKEHPGAVVESFRTLAGKDAWHAAKGYRSGRDMTAIVFHREYGEWERHRCDIALIEKARAA